MIVSLNWLKDFVDIPSDVDPRELALKFTTTTAEVDGIEQMRPNASGLVAGRIASIESVPGEEKLQRVEILAGKAYRSLSSAPDLAVGDVVIYAPPGAMIAGHRVGSTDPQGRPAEGMIVAGQGIGLVQMGANAIFLPPGTEPGRPIDLSLFEDWVIEIDNKSITHRPDCWGQCGIARELAAILKLPLKPYEVTPTAVLRNDLPVIPIEIDDPTLCPRYSALLMKGLKAQPAPLWMQVRLALCGQRPIALLVDLTNYVMLELGQPMHAFDGGKVPNVQVALASPGERFTTLDGVTRALPLNTLMIQSNRKSVAIAGIMGGAATEVGDKTDAVLLESANFDAATIRRAATAMGHRTEAAARFEKSLDPANTVLGIARFHRLAARELPQLTLASTLSDCFPNPRPPASIDLDCGFASRFIGKEVSPREITEILTRLEFQCEAVNTPAGSALAAGRSTKLRVTPPSYRATKDIEIEADLIEEVARFVGYNAIEPSLPRITSRHFPESPELVLEERSLDFLCVGGGFIEVHSYIWYDDEWTATLGFDPGPCLTVRNPASENCRRLRQTLVPGLILFAERNRRHYERFALAEIGSVFLPGVQEVTSAQHRCLGLLAAQQGRQADEAVWQRLQAALGGWAQQVLGRSIDLRAAAACRPWEDAGRVAEIAVADRTIGRVSVIPLTLKQRIDERLRSWSMAVAEINLTAVADLVGHHEKLPVVPRHPRVELDFSVLITADRAFAGVRDELRAFEHALLCRLSYLDSFEGGSIAAGKRSLTFRATIGREDRTLSDADIQEFRSAFCAFLAARQMELRG